MTRSQLSIKPMSLLAGLGVAILIVIAVFGEIRIVGNNSGTHVCLKSHWSLANTVLSLHDVSDLHGLSADDLSDLQRCLQ